MDGDWNWEWQSCLGLAIEDHICLTSGIILETFVESLDGSLGTSGFRLCSDWALWLQIVALGVIFGAGVILDIVSHRKSLMCLL